ncbi:MAG TPA: PQQ-binding-like beta-propeller repeat protein [Planctomycetaceae bacterium]|nr:PQQ-binding-like beta-propeller repeat protein [Planctomycetaceae bacterium]
MTHPLLLFTLVACALPDAPLAAENWNAWRGPRGDGTSREAHAPVRWSATENVAWKVPVPGDGHASPIIWDDRVFLVTCLPDRQERMLLGVDAATGRTLWQQSVVRSPLETKHQLNSHASSTPATDGELVYVAFLEVDGRTQTARNVSEPRPVTPGQVVVAAYDFEGHRRWVARPGEFVSVHGFCSCPLLFEDLVIINGDHDGDSYLAALDRGTGRTVWKVPRENQTRSYVTPIIREFGGRTQMILSGDRTVASYDPRTGGRHWIMDGPTEQFVASPVDNGELVFLTAGFPDKHLLAIRPDGRGRIGDEHIAWREREGASYVPSPIACGDYFLVTSDNGIASCFVAKTGERVWRERLGRHYSASPVTAGGLVYFLDDDGVTKVVRPGREFELVAENHLGEACSASPAVSGGSVYIRTERHLYRIGFSEP